MKTQAFRILLVSTVLVLASCSQARSDSLSTISNPSPSPTELSPFTLPVVLESPPAAPVATVTPPAVSSATMRAPAAPTAPVKQPASGKQISIDFRTCAPKRERVDTAFGSTTYEITGKQGDKCVIKYGGEVENPNWDGTLDTTCLVPLTMGQPVFRVTDNGVDFSALGPYCTKTKK